jgi:hypothetical protein
MWRAYLVSKPDLKNRSILLGQFCQTPGLFIAQLNKVSHYREAGDGGQVLNEWYIRAIGQPQDENEDDKSTTKHHPARDRSEGPSN